MTKVIAGAGAPRFNVDTEISFFFVDCSASGQTPADLDPAQWTRSRSVLTTCRTECSPTPIPYGRNIQRIKIIFDESTHSSSASGPMSVGLAVIDIICIDGTYIRSGKGVAEPNGTEPLKDED